MAWQAQQERIDELERRLKEAEKDAELLDSIADEYFHLVPFDRPTGGDDVDVGWRVLQGHMAEKEPRVVAEVLKDDPRAAINAAIEQGKDKVKSI